MKVETYGANKVTTTQVSNQRATPVRAANTSLAPGMRDAIRGYQIFQQRADETAAEEALVNFEREKNKLFFDPKEGYFNRQGRDAFEGGEATRKALQKLQDNFANGISSQRARDLFKRSSSVHLTRGFNDIDKHAAKGMRAYEAATKQARLENSIESASLYWNNDEEAQVQFAVGHESVLEMAEDQGLDAEATNEMLQNYESKFVKSRIEAALANDFAKANDLFEKFGDRIEGADRVEIESSINKAKFDMQAGSKADEIIKSGAGTLTELMAQVDTMPTSTPEEIEMKSEVQRLVSNRHTINQRMIKEQQDAVYENYAKQIQDGVATSRSIPGKAWTAMTVKQRSNIKKMEKANAKGPAKRVTDERVFQDLLVLSDEELAKLDPLDYYDKLKDSDYNTVQKMINKAKKGDTKDPEYLDTRGNATRRKETMTTIFGETPTKLEGDDRDRYNAVSRSLQLRIEQEIEANGGKKLSPSRLDEIHNEFTRKQIIERKMWFDKEVTLDDYDDADIDLATKYLQQLGAPINAVNIINLINKNPEKFGD